MKKAVIVCGIFALLSQVAFASDRTQLPRPSTFREEVSNFTGEESGMIQAAISSNRPKLAAAAHRYLQAVTRHLEVKTAAKEEELRQRKLDIENPAIQLAVQRYFEAEAGIKEEELRQKRIEIDRLEERRADKIRRRKEWDMKVEAEEVRIAAKRNQICIVC